MMLGARTAAWAKSGGSMPTAKDYVQDGLVAMWDGIENAGWGVHDPNAMVWKDLVGSCHLRGYGSVVWEDDSWKANKDSDFYAPVSDAIINAFDKTITIEAVQKFNADSTGYLFTVINYSYKARFVFVYAKKDAIYTLYKQNAWVAPSLPFSPTPRYTISNIYDNQGHCDVYYNGLWLGSTVTSPHLLSKNSQYVSIGNSYGDAARGVKNYKGNMNCVRFYNRALTAAEVAANCAIDEARFGPIAVLNILDARG